LSSATKIFLADLAHTGSVTDQSLTVPLGIGYVKAYCDRALGDKVAIRLFKRPDKFLAAAEAEPPHVFGFANYGWNANLNRDVGRYIRKKFPDALIVAGGPNIDPQNDRRLAFLKQHDYIDFLIVDGGEQPFAELLDWHRAGHGDTSKLPDNIVWRDGETIRATPERALKKIIDDIPSPYLSGDLDEFLAAGMIPLFETNRGCPFQCTFCAWGSASKDLVRRLDVDQAIAEFEYVGKRSTARNWIVCDANFGILKRDIELARVIRKIKDEHGYPEKCHIWLAKNVTERNLVIGEIMADMIVPVMAVQSLDDRVLKHIKRDNISLETYEEYQKKFHRIGSRTYSDLIVPLPGETIATHIAALRTLIDLGVDIIQSHNMRLLAGAETNSAETRDSFNFRTRYRLIHGDAGIYRAPDGTEIRAFEYEESLRSTDTMSEDDLFYLRKLHFLVDFCWNIEVYKPLLQLGTSYGISPVDVLVRLLADAESGRNPALAKLFTDFDRCSEAEWFDDAEDIERYFADPTNFQRLLNQEFEKLNIHFSVIALRDFKPAFDAAVADSLASFGATPQDKLDATAALTFALFPPLNTAAPETAIEIPSDWISRDEGSRDFSVAALDKKKIQLVETKARRDLRTTISATRAASLSKILNTQGISLRDLRLTIAEETRFDSAFRRAL
jgi:radical SAM superfamily enzyme YgiQ (UPF0313 family)